MGRSVSNSANLPRGKKASFYQEFYYNDQTGESLIWIVKRNAKVSSVASRDMPNYEGKLSQVNLCATTQEKSLKNVHNSNGIKILFVRLTE